MEDRFRLWIKKKKKSNWLFLHCEFVSHNSDFIPSNSDFILRIVSLYQFKMEGQDGLWFVGLFLLYSAAKTNKSPSKA